MAKQHKWGRRSLARMEGVDRQLTRLAFAVLPRCPFDLTIPAYAGVRTDAEQLFLFDRGDSKCDGIIDISKHQKGEALDIVPFIDGKAVWSKPHSETVALLMYDEAMKQGVELIWGGFFNWTFDGNHYQLGV